MKKLLLSFDIFNELMNEYGSDDDSSISREEEMSNGNSNIESIENNNNNNNSEDDKLVEGLVIEEEDEKMKRKENEDYDLLSVWNNKYLLICLDNDIEYTIISSYKDVNKMLDEIEKHLKKNSHTIEHLNKRILKLVYLYIYCEFL